MDAHTYLVDWAVNFFKNKDAFTKKIVSIEKNKECFDVYIKYKDKEQYVAAMPTFNAESLIQKLSNNKSYSAVILNSQENFKEMMKHWKKLTDFKFLTIVFCNPFSNTDKKWMIYPHTHDKISDHSSLELGLKSMFDMVEPINEQKLLSSIKS